MLLLFIYIFLVTHLKLNCFTMYAYLNVFFLFLYSHFGVLNKTNLFKSIHSFTSSVYSSVSYSVFIYAIGYYSYLLFLVHNKKIFLYYNFAIWGFFYMFLYCTKAVVFSKQFFFYYLNMVFVLLLFYCNFIVSLPLSVLFFFTQSGFFFLVICIYVYFRILFIKKYLILHIVTSVIIFKVLSFLTGGTFVYVYLSPAYTDYIFNFSYVNSCLAVFKQNTLTSTLINSVHNIFILKNLILNSTFMVQNLTITSILLKTHIKYNIFYIKVLYLFIVTKVYYSKQKPRFKYYN